MKKARISVRKDVKWEGEEKKTRGWMEDTDRQLDWNLDEGSSEIIRIIMILLFKMFLFFMFGIWLQGCNVM